MPPPPPSAFQRWLIRTFQPSLAGNPILGIILGALVAIVLGGAIAVILEAIFHAVAPPFGFVNNNTTFHPSGQDVMDYVIGLVPLHAPFRDGMQLFFLMHGAAGHATYGPGAFIPSYSFNALLSGLLIIPALALTLGGYIAASTDLQNRALSSLLRGLAIALPYAALLLALAPQVNGTIPLYPGEPTTDVNTFAIDSTSLFIYGLIWGALFGLLGASLKLGRGRWRHMVVEFLHTRRRPQIVGMVMGGLAASGLGISLSLLVLFSLLAFTAFSTPLFTQNLCYYNGGFGNWQYMAGWAVAQGPLHAANLFFYSFGAPVNIVSPKSLNLGACFYINSATGSDHATFSMLGGSPHLPPWTYAFVAIPIISLFLGGRVSAAFGRAQSVGQGLVQGVLIAAPFTILMMLLSVFTMLVIQNTGQPGSSATNTPLTQSFGVGAFDLLLWALLSGAVLGGLGGIYQTTSIRLSVSRLLSSLAAPLRWLGTPGYVLFDRLRGGNRSAPRTTALRLLYGAVFSALVLVIAVMAAAICFIAFNQSIPYVANTRIRDILSTLLVALPGLLLISAGAAALSEEKIPRAQAVMAMPPVMPTGPMPPMPPISPMPPGPPQFPPQSYPNYQGGV